jgi:hypothetical protein
MGIGVHGVGSCVSVASGSAPAVAVPVMEQQNVAVLQVSVEDIPKLVRSVSGLASVIMQASKPFFLYHAMIGHVLLCLVQAEDWLRDALASEEVRSKERTSKFYANLSTDIQNNNPRVVDKVDAHEKKEEWLMLFHLKKMLEHLVDRGVGQYVPGLLDKLGKINTSVDSECYMSAYV